MSILKRIIAALTVMAFGVSVSFAAPTPTKEKRQTLAGKYLTAAETAEFVVKNKANTLFVDVRTQVEVEYVGYSYLMDKNIPWHFIDVSKWNEKKHRFSDTPLNDNFVADVEKAMKEKGLNKDSNIVFMCRSGARSIKAVNALFKAGYKNAYTVVDGFEGGKDKTHHHRIVNGWKNTAPADTWGYKLDKSKMYL